MGIILVIVATALSCVFMPIGFLYSLVVLPIRNDLKTWWKQVNEYLYIMALGLDQLGNAVMQEMFNDLLLKPGAYRFGNPDQTLSYIFGKNKQLEKLNWLGLFIARVLDWLDPNHTDKAVKNEEDDFDNFSAD